MSENAANNNKDQLDMADLASNLPAAAAGILIQSQFCFINSQFCEIDRF